MIKREIQNTRLRSRDVGTKIKGEANYREQLCKLPFIYLYISHAYISILVKLETNTKLSRTAIRRNFPVAGYFAPAERARVVEREPRGDAIRVVHVAARDLLSNCD